MARTTTTAKLGESATGDRSTVPAAHTPGPWRVFIAKQGHAIIGIGELTGEGIADCGFGVWRGGSAEAMANARLISAAPDLYDVIQKMLWDFEAAENPTTIFARHSDALKAAVAKAMGAA